MRQHLIATAVAAAIVSFTPFAHADDDTVIGGKMYADLSNVDQSKNGNDTDASGTGFDVKRFYLTIDHKFDDIWSANLTTDFNYVSADAETQVFVKKAYLQGKFNDYFIVRAGSADMPWIPYVESWYGYRYIDSTLTDRLKFANSADWGVHLGSVTSGMFNYAVSLVNGGGYKNPSRSSGMDMEGRIGFQPVDGLVIAGGAYSGDRGGDLETVPSRHSASRWDAMVAYKGGPVRVGAEYFSSDDWNQVTKGPKDSSEGYSAWASFNFTKDWAVFARYDNAKLSQDLDPTAKDTYYNAGVEYQVRKGIKVSGVWKHEEAKASPVNADGVATFAKTKTNEIGVYAEIAF